MSDEIRLISQMIQNVVETQKDHGAKLDTVVGLSSRVDSIEANQSKYILKPDVRSVSMWAKFGGIIGTAIVSVYAFIKST